MSLNISKNKIIINVKKKRINISTKQIIFEAGKLFMLHEKLTKFLRYSNVTGYESDKRIGIGSESSGISKGQGTNPLLWELGHLCYFYEVHCFQYILPDYTFFIDYGYIYDSFVTSRDVRFEFKKHDKILLFKYFDYIKNTLFKILNGKIKRYEKYFIFLAILHHHMHLESFIFTKKLLNINNKLCFSKLSLNPDIIFEYAFYKGGYFKQGNTERENLIAFDNELPRFLNKVKSFYISKYCVTEKQVKDFIIKGGYNNKYYWSENGWKWKTENDINLPFYWIKKDNKLLIKNYNKFRFIKNNLPACHMSYYEAEAICKYLGGRLPTESEWEYVATNKGKTKYPWGNSPSTCRCNLNYSGCIVDVSSFAHGNNKKEVCQLFGNVWEWCQEPLYPYQGFKIDPVYKEFSYPFFGFKKILRGGSWACPNILINSRYRNAQMPDCRIQFTGFRVVTDVPI